MNNAIAIQTQGLVKNYGRVKALRGVDLTVHQREIFGFLGPNGSGKTTTIRCLLDLIRPNGGNLQVLGLNPQQDPVGIRQRTGYLPGELRVDDAFTVESALRYFNSLRHGKADWQYVRTLAQKIDLDLKVRVKNLSKGNKQKVGVVQALMHRPELLLLDEPTAGLDPLVQQEVLHLVAQAQADGATVFFSSHVLSEVQQIADRVGIIRQGVVVEVAETDTLINRSIRRVYLRLRQPVDAGHLALIPGITVLTQSDGLNMTLQVEGEMDALIKALASFPVVDFETERPTLEEVFLAYYASDAQR